MNVFQPKFFTGLKNYSSKKLVNDIIAGIIVAIIALPLSIALAIASGVSPEKGLYTAIVAGFVISLLGGSNVNISGPTAAFATIVAGIVATYGTQGLVIATIMAGLMLVVMGLCKFGVLIKYIPYTITTGFTSGIALTIVIGQLKDFMGLTFAEGTHAVETMEKLSICGYIIALLAIVLTYFMPLSLVYLYPTACAALLPCFAITVMFAFVKRCKEKLNTFTLVVSAIAVELACLCAGALMLASMLSGIEYYVNNLIFRGIKLSLFFPVLFSVVAYYFMFLKNDEKTIFRFTYCSPCFGYVCKRLRFRCSV